MDVAIAITFLTGVFCAGHQTAMWLSGLWIAHRSRLRPAHRLLSCTA